MSSSQNVEKVKQIMQMGFSKEQAMNALLINENKL
jgi:uncharacterized UBP type Zn finger protein